MSDMLTLALEYGGFTSLDKVGDDFHPTQFPHVMISAKDKDARAHIQMMMLAKIKTMFAPFEIKVPLSESYRLHDLAKISLIEKREYSEDKEIVSGYIAENMKWKLDEFL